MSSPNLHADRDLDLSNSTRGVWLVKVRVVPLFLLFQQEFILLSDDRIGVPINCEAYYKPYTGYTQI